MWDSCLYKLKVLSNITPIFVTWVEYMMSCPLMLIGGGVGNVLLQSGR